MGSSTERDLASAGTTFTLPLAHAGNGWVRRQRIAGLPYSLYDLLEGAKPSIPGGLPNVIGVNADSRAIVAGEAFFALPGAKTHGYSFAMAAVGRGALAIVTDRKSKADLGVPVVVVDDVRAAYARAAARSFAPQPQTTVAVTGTNGKTSVASFVRQIWSY
ncbi:MAG: UDP-N-acetylmuramoylalanyl-D-glutamate--2,6-diaminopimelate ligase, partial [Hyphomicrobiales bacterium]|nr:UDP-N-acetylmuramoylalanyl-D-glutamate--2,6-diaminopimelate ligase [Hyphomicrobiales bacterium]